MMDFITRCWRRAEPAALVLLGLALAGPVAAQEIAVDSARVDVSGKEAHLDAALAIDLGSVLDDAVARGLPLSFVMDFELSRPRSLWFSKTVAELHREWRLSFDSLTGRCTLGTAEGAEGYASCAEALHELGRLRLPLALTEPLVPGQAYEAELRLQLDRQRLPKPLQVEAIGSRDWSLSSGWHRWTFTVE